MVALFWLSFHVSIIILSLLKHNWSKGFRKKIILTLLFFVFKMFMASLWPPLVQWWRDLERQSLCPALCLGFPWATGCTGSVRNQERDWSGLGILMVALAQHLPSLSRASSPSPETPTLTHCTYKWKAWKLRTQLFITVHEGHSHTRACRPVQKQLWNLSLHRELRC